jgi:hypothetical protein
VCVCVLVFVPVQCQDREKKLDRPNGFCDLYFLCQKTNLPPRLKMYEGPRHGLGWQILIGTTEETKWPIQRMENLWNNKRVRMKEGENKTGKDWDLVTCHYGVRLANHAPYRDWIRFQLFYCRSLLPQSTSLVSFHSYFRLSNRQDFLH